MTAKLKNSSPTVKDVAERAGVSTATVSRVISGGENFSQQLIEQENQAIEDLKYRPSRVARNLRVHKANTGDLVVSDFQNPFFTSIMREIQDTLMARGFVFLASNSDEDQKQKKIHIETLLAEEVAGIILVPARPKASSYANIEEIMAEQGFHSPDDFQKREEGSKRLIEVVMRVADQIVETNSKVIH